MTAKNQYNSFLVITMITAVTLISGCSQHGTPRIYEQQSLQRLKAAQEQVNRSQNYVYKEHQNEQDK